MYGKDERIALKFADTTEFGMEDLAIVEEHLHQAREVLQQRLEAKLMDLAPGRITLVGCGAAVIGGMGSGATSVDALGIGAAFGLTIVAMAYGIGQISGCHINPAVSFGVLVAGRMTTQDFITYLIAQVLGAIAGAVVLYVILSGKASGWNGGLGQNGVTSITVNNDEFNATTRSDGVTITVKGTLDQGKAKVSEVTITGKGQKGTYTSIEKVPAEHKEKVQKLTEVIWGNRAPARGR